MNELRGCIKAQYEVKEYSIELEMSIIHPLELIFEQQKAS